MNQFIFKSRWIAIAFAVLTLFSAYVFIGGWRDSETPADGAPVDAQVAQGTGEPTPAATSDQSMDDTEFVDDEELIDDASGDDPNPSDGDSVDNGDDSDSGDSGFADADVPEGAVVARPGPAQYAPDGTPIVMAN